LTRAGWRQDVCVGDYDYDGFDHLSVSYYGQNHLYRNTGKGIFKDATQAAGLQQETQWATGCAFVDDDLHGKPDSFVAKYVNFEKDRIPLPRAMPDCNWKGVPVMCGGRGLPGGTY
jgi:hypothetical protein